MSQLSGRQPGFTAELSLGDVVPAPGEGLGSGPISDWHCSKWCKDCRNCPWYCCEVTVTPEVLSYK